MYQLLFVIMILISYLPANNLQSAINNATSGATIKLSLGVHKGSITIDKPLTIIGVDKDVIIEGLNKDTVIIITSSHVTLKNLTIQKSGQRVENLDAAIKVSKANHIEINNCIIKDTLFGIDFDRVNNSKIINNFITSKNFSIRQRGDALRLFYSHNNLIKNNQIYNSRDVKFSYSHKNIFTKNHIKNSRFALHLHKSNDMTIDNNHLLLNSMGMIIGASQNSEIRNNTIKSGKGAAGIGVLVKGVHNFQFHDNIVSYNSKAFYIDAKHNETVIKRFLKNNEISYNKEAFHFHGAIKQNWIENNTIVGNIDDVVKSVRGNSTAKNIIQNNYWDQYSGFDVNKDNIGDRPYKVYQYADRLWHYNNKVKYFYASPVISILNFILQVAPFIDPIVLLEDSQPLVKLKP